MHKMFKLLFNEETNICFTGKQYTVILITSQ